MLYLADGRRAFFKGVYPLPEGSAVRWSLEEEERVYQLIGHLVTPWAPAYYGSITRQGWHALVIEAVPGDRMPPWSGDRARRAVRSYAEFHRSTLDVDLPEWLPRDHHLEFAGFWQAITSDSDALDRLVLLPHDKGDQRAARGWLANHAGSLTQIEGGLAKAERFALLHFDTRSDNIRLDGDTLRIFDWPFACAGPPEFDFAAFAQSVASEGGPTPEEQVGWYGAVLPLDQEALSASIVAIAGYFAHRGPMPDLEGLPRLRSVQRRQLKAALPWAARRLGLPPPEWLASVAD
jgi:Ser/Thr protein kinase RdoA (MazF antagonist)